MNDQDLVDAHRRAVAAGDWDTAREIERSLIVATDNTERPEDGSQPTQAPGGDAE